MHSPWVPANPKDKDKARPKLNRKQKLRLNPGRYAIPQVKPQVKPNPQAKGKSKPEAKSQGKK